MASVDALSYTVIGLTSNTFYFVNVTASNVYCGEGENGTTNVTTNMRLVTELLLLLLQNLLLDQPQI